MHPVARLGARAVPTIGGYIQGVYWNTARPCILEVLGCLGALPPAADEALH